MADDNLMDQSEIEQLLNQTAGGAASEKTEGESPAPAEEVADSSLSQGDVEQMLRDSDGGGGGEAASSTPAPEAPSAPEVPSASDAPPIPISDDDDKLLGQTTSANVRERLNLNLSGVEEFLETAKAPTTTASSYQQKLEVVIER